MTVSSASYTTNSIKITIANEVSPTPLIAAVDTAITTLGWSQYDYIAPNSSTVITSASSTTGTITPTGGLNALTTFTSSGVSTSVASSYSGVGPYSSSGYGTGATFNITKTGAGTAYSGFITVTIVSSGTGYIIGDTMTISGALLGGVLTTNDLILTVGGSIQTSNINGYNGWLSLSGTCTSNTSTWYGVTALSTSGSGTGAIFQISRIAGTTYLGTTTVIIVSAGTGYAIGDTITISGALLGGVLTTNNLVITVGAINSTISNGLSRGSSYFFGMPVGIFTPTQTGTSVTAAATYYGVPQLSTSGTGTSATFHVTKTGAGTVYSGFTTLYLVNPGSGYAVGDTITLSGALLGGALTTNDLIFTVVAVNSSTYQNSGVITNMVSTSAFSCGMQLSATAGTGTLYGGTPLSIIVNRINNSTSISYTINGGTVPTSGTVTNVLQQNLNTQSPLYTYVYRAVCADNLNYKYLILRWDPTKQQFFTAAAEGWSLTTHYPLNETYGFNGTFGHGYDLKDCQILISATSSHFMIWPWIRGSMGLWSAVFEFERIAAEDTAALAMPDFAWTNSIILGYSSDNGSYPLVFPRLPNSASSAAMVPVTNRGRTTALGDNYNLTYGWNTALSVISSFSADHNTNLAPVGRAYNCSATKPFGAGLDTTTLPLATGGWADTTGINSTCLIAPLNGGLESASTSSLFNANVAGRPQNNGYSATGVVDMLLIGNIAWCACGTAGIRTYDTSTTGALGTLTTRLAGNWDKLIFDGIRTIYAIYVNAGTGGTTLCRVDTETYATSNITFPFAVHHLAIDGQNVYVAINGGTTQPRVAIVSRWITSDGSTGTGFAVTVTYLPIVVTASYIANIFPDYRGNILITYTTNSLYSRAASNGTLSIEKINIIGLPTITIRATTAAPIGATQYPDYSSGFYYDPISAGLVSIHGVASVNTGQAYTGYFSSLIYAYQSMYSYSTATFASTLIQNVQTIAYTGGATNISAISAATGISQSTAARLTSLATVQNVMPYRGNYLMNVELYIDGGFITSRYQNSVLFGASGNATAVATPVLTTNTLSISAKYALALNNYNIRNTYSNGTSALKNIGGSVYYVNNLFNMNSTSGVLTGRLVVKG
jgi:hypothetical protein